MRSAHDESQKSQSKYCSIEAEIDSKLRVRLHARAVSFELSHVSTSRDVPHVRVRRLPRKDGSASRAVNEMTKGNPYWGKPQNYFPQRWVNYVECIFFRDSLLY